MTIGDALAVIVFILAFPLWAIGLAIADRIGGKFQKASKDQKSRDGEGG